jgi:hypothetical protein
MRVVAVSALASVMFEIGQPGSAFAGRAVGADAGGTISVGATTSVSPAGTPEVPTAETPATSDSSLPVFVPICTTDVLTLNNAVGPPPGVTTPGSWFSILCTNAGGGTTTTNLWISNTPGAPPAAPAVDPYAVALQAENSLNLPSPTIGFNPPTNAVVNLPTWLWVDAALWHPNVVSATVGTVTATATATPTSVTWNLGDGGSLVCAGPGTAYRTDLPSSAQQTSCSYVYQMTSLGQPSPDGNPNDGAFRISATVAWQVVWTAQGAPGGGNLPALTTNSAANLRVEQVESVNS